MNRMSCISLIIRCSIHTLLICRIVTAAHIRIWLWESLLLRITLLWESLLRVALLLRITLLLRVARLLRITLLLRIALLRITLLRITLLLRVTLLRITLLLRIALLLRITSLLLSCIEVRETACSLLLSFFWLLIEEVKVFTLISSLLRLIFSIERI